MGYVTYLGIAPLIVAVLIAVMWAYSYLVLALARNVLFGAATLLILYVAETTLIVLPRIHLYLYIYPQDIVISLLVAAGVLRLFWLRELGGRRMLLGIVFLLLLLSIGRGLVIFGAKAAGNESRFDWWFLAAVPYFASFRYSRELSEKMMVYWMKAALALCALVVFRWTATFLHLGIAGQWEVAVGTNIYPMRVVGYECAYFLLIGSLISVHLILTGNATRWHRWMLYLSAPISMMLEHRTVWVCGAIAALLFVLYTRRVPRQMLIAVLSLLFVMAILVTAFVIGPGSKVQHSYGVAVENSDDWTWRVDGWTDLYEDHFNDTVSTLFGEPYGSGMGRFAAGQFVDTIAHNEYLQLALRIGVVGLLCFVGIYVSSLWTIHFASRDHAGLLFPGKNFWRIWIFMSFACFVTYSASYSQSMLFGMLISVSTSVGSQAAYDRRARFHLLQTSLNKAVSV